MFDEITINEERINELKAKTELTLDECNELIEASDVEGNLLLSDSHIKTLPEGLTVTNWLAVNGTDMTELPNKLIVRALDVSMSKITTFPEDIYIGGIVDGSGSEISHLPDNLVVGGNLILNNTPIESLPKGLIVGGDLYIEDTNITTVPDDLIVGGYVISDNIYDDDFNSCCRKLNDGEIIDEKYIYLDPIVYHIDRIERLYEYTLYACNVPYKSVVTDGEYLVDADNINNGINIINALRAKDATNLTKHGHLDIFSELTFDKMVELYQDLTCAPKREVERFKFYMSIAYADCDTLEIADVMALMDRIVIFGEKDFKGFFSEKDGVDIVC